MGNYYHKGSKVLVPGIGAEPQLENFRHSVATETLAADTTLTAEDSGKTIFVSGASAIDVTLPSPVAGMNFKFIITNVTADVDIVQAGSSDDFVGTIMGVSANDSAVSGDTKIIFDQSGGSVVGDWVFLACDGTNWYVQGLCDANGGVVFG